MRTVSLTIDGQKVTASEDAKVLWAALDNGIYIPSLCALRDRTEPAASCRLCFVEIEGYSRPVTACTEPVKEGMVVNTRGADALRLARTGFELLMAKRFKKLLRELPIDSSSPELVYDPNKCVLCGRCVWVCRERLGIGALGFAHRGFRRVVTTFGDAPIGESGCTGCAECALACPTGALTLKDQQEGLKKGQLTAAP